ncbi:MAG: tRNA epoxyqueuosine(34) reductase QueG [Planctomycetes bacterium]|nr:tRNA epoxyqueuosine(34) reductase QueG [Planctomycetota bacterium]
MLSSASQFQLHTATISTDIKTEAQRIGFELVGIAPAVTPSGFHDFQQWLNRGYAGEMDYLPRREDAYEHPRHVLDGVKSIVMLGANYNTAKPQAAGPNEGAVSRYASGSTDYHDVLKNKLDQLADFLHEQQPGCRTRGVVDTAPLLERDFARLAGLGWFGKNTLLINKKLGSWLFLAALLTDVELEYDQPHESSHCGNCTRCLDACPTDAFPEPYVLDARKCISYLNIELRDPIPVELREGMGEWLFGCDICQEVCPWNNKAPLSEEPAFQPIQDLSPVDAVELLQLTDEQFRERFRHTPLWRPKRAGLLRNAAIVLGNRGNERAVPVLIDALNDSEPMIRGAAAWALGKLGGKQAATALQSRLTIEENEDVSDEIRSALIMIDERRVTSDE